MNATARDERRRLRAARRTNDGSDWRWWTKLGIVVLSSVAAVLLILAGTVRFLDQAQREHDRAECLRSAVQQQAGSNADMASVVLDARLPQPERAEAFRKWGVDQARVADQIGRC